MKKIATILLVLFVVISIFGVSFGTAGQGQLGVIGIFDSGQFSGEPLGLTGRITETLNAAGYEVIVLTGQQMTDPQQVSRSKLDALVYVGIDYTLAIGQNCLDYIAAGGRFWNISENGMFSGREFEFDIQGDKFVLNSEIMSDEEKLRIAHSQNPNAVKDPLSVTLLRQINRGSLFVWRSIPKTDVLDKPWPMPEGQKYFPKSIEAYCKASMGSDILKVISLSSGDMPWIRPSSKVVGMAKSKYKLPIWAGGRPSTSAGYPLGMIADKSVDYGGARTLFTSYKAMELLGQSQQDWDAFIQEAAAVLVDRELSAVIKPIRPIIDVSQAVNILLRFDNYDTKAKKVAVKLEAVRHGPNGKHIKLAKTRVKLPERGQVTETIALNGKELPEGLYDLQLWVDGKMTHKHIFTVMPGVSVPLKRENMFDNPNVGRFAIMFRNYDQIPNNAQTTLEVGLHGASVHIPWVPEGETIETAINWPALDRWIEDAEKNGLKIIIDAWDHRMFPKYFIHTKNPNRPDSIYKFCSVVVNENRDRWVRLWGKVAQRYADKTDTVIGMFLTLFVNSFWIDFSDAAAADFVDYLCNNKQVILEQLAQRYQMDLSDWTDIRPPDVQNPAGDMIARLLDYHEFWKHQYWLFLEASAAAIQKSAPNMAMLLRGAYHCPNFRYAAKLMDTYGPISPHAENVETTANTVTHMYGGHLRYGVPIGAENGWPACRGEPARHAFFKALMGKYNVYLWSGASGNQLLPVMEPLAEYAYLDAHLRNTKAMPLRLGVLGDETTSILTDTGVVLGSDWRTPRTHMPLFFMGYTGALEISIDEPYLDGLDVIIDGGNNPIVRASALKTLMNWVADGHTMIITDKMGLIGLDGRRESVADRLRSEQKLDCGIAPDKVGPAKPYLPMAEGSAVDSIDIGKGKVLILNDLKGEGEETTAIIRSLMDKLGIKRPVTCEPLMPFTVRQDDKSLYVIIYDVDDNRIGGYFNYDDAAEDLVISDEFKELILTTDFEPTAATDLAKDEKLEISGKDIKFKLRQGHGMVIRIDR